MRYIPAICIGVLLLCTFRLYGHARFYIDDFNNLYWVQQQSAAAMGWHVVNPFSDFFRPTGMMFYWLALRLFDLNAAAYHAMAWSFHALNTLMVYFVLKRLTDSRAGAAVGSMLFASQGAFADIYWNFGTIFELAGACAFFTGILLWARPKRSWSWVLLCTLVFLFGVKAKEMVVTLPAIWLLQDLLLRQKARLTMLAHVVAPGLVGAAYGLDRFLAMRETNPIDPYYMDLRWITLGRGFGGYFNVLFQTDWRWQVWCIGFVALALIFAALKNRRALFFQAYFFVSFLPVIFMINHREPYLSYIPFLGVCGLACLMVKAGVELAEGRVGARRTALASYALFPFLCLGAYMAQKIGSEERRLWQRPTSMNMDTLVSSLRSLPPPPSHETVFFDSAPYPLNASLLHNAAQVSWRRTDVEVRVLPEFPEDARYKFHLEDWRVIRVP